MKLAAEPERENDAPKSRDVIYLLLDLVICFVKCCVCHTAFYWYEKPPVCENTYS